MSERVITFKIDSKMDEVFDKLKKHFHASSRAEVLRKAIALLEVASDAEDDGAEIILRKDTEEKQVVVR